MYAKALIYSCCKPDVDVLNEFNVPKVQCRVR